MQNTYHYCYLCEGDSCTKPLTHLPYCNTTFNCFKSAIKKIEDTVNFSRGCITSLQVNDQICGNATHLNDDYECCLGDFCNDAHFANQNEPAGVNYFGLLYILTYFVLISAVVAFAVVISTLIKVYQFEKLLTTPKEHIEIQEIDSDNRAAGRSSE